MRIELRDAGAPPELPPLSLALETGTVHALEVETDERPRLLSLLLGGRLRPTAGSVRVDGVEDPAVLRRRVALVDTPFASEPSPGVPLRVAVAEELSFAGRDSSRRGVRETLERLGLGGAARTPVALVPAGDRVRLLIALALLRPGIDALVLTSPERHGGDPADWFPALEDAARSTLVAVVTDRPTASALLRLGASDAAASDREPA